MHAEVFSGVPLKSLWIGVELFEQLAIHLQRFFIVLNVGFQVFYLLVKLGMNKVVVGI